MDSNVDSYNKCLVVSVKQLNSQYSFEKKKWYQTFVVYVKHKPIARLVTGQHYVEGQLGIYFPVGAIVPDKLLWEMDLLGRLAGKKCNRVAAKEMFGEMSEGIFHGQTWIDDDDNLRHSKWNENWREGDDVTKELGVTFKDV